MLLQSIPYDFSICKIDEITNEIFQNDFTFAAKSENEVSLICRTDCLPEHVRVVENGWRGFRIAEDAAFEKYGMISFLTKIIAGKKSGVLVVATYDTDYLFVKSTRYEEVKKGLIENGCEFAEPPHP